jgi:uncharacterized damage-inducible protein DinB
MHEHRLWARARFLSACSDLPDEMLSREFPIGRGSVLKSLTHLYAAEVVWVEALHNTADEPLIADDAFATLDGLVGAWPDVDARWHAYLAVISEDELTRTIHRHSASLGRMYSMQAQDVMVHVCTHQAHTLAQALNMLRELHVDDLPALDYVFWSAGLDV